MHLREFNVDTITARRAPSSFQTVVQTLFHNLLFLFFFPSLFAKLIYYFRSTTFDLLPLGYYPEATQIRPPPCQGLFQPEPSRCVDQSDRVALAVKRVLCNRRLGRAAEKRGAASASLHDAAVRLFC